MEEHDVWLLQGFRIKKGTQLIWTVSVHKDRKPPLQIIVQLQKICIKHGLTRCDRTSCMDIFTGTRTQRTNAFKEIKPIDPQCSTGFFQSDKSKTPKKFGWFITKHRLQP